MTSLHRCAPMRALTALAPTILLLGAVGPARARASRPAEIHVSGATVVDKHNRRVHLHGVNAASMEWSVDGEGHILTTLETAIRDWHANIIRLPLSQDRWFGKTPQQQDDGAAYRALVKQAVDLCSRMNSYIILDLHWSDANQWGQQIGQHKMPDSNSIAFWKSIAPLYKNNPAVLFDLYNEPHDVSWDVWHDGGTVTEQDRRTGVTVTYDAPGMQAMLDAVRSTGAKNVVVAGGLDWSYDMSGFLNGKQLSDPKGNGVIYANHNYPFKGDTVDQWQAKIEAASKVIPIIVSEFGSGGGGGFGRRQPQDDAWVQRVLQILHDRDLDWTAWDMHPAAVPCLISDWNYTPTPKFGVYVKEALNGTLPAYTPPASAPSEQKP